MPGSTPPLQNRHCERRRPIFSFPFRSCGDCRPVPRLMSLPLRLGSRSKKSPFERPVALSARTGLSALSLSTPVLHLYFVATTYFPSECYSIGMAGVLFRLAPKNPICRRGLAIEELHGTLSRRLAIGPASSATPSPLGSGLAACLGLIFCALPGRRLPCLSRCAASKGQKAKTRSAS